MIFLLVNCRLLKILLQRKILLTLMYHGVLPNNKKLDPITQKRHILQSEFDKQCRFLREFFHLVSKGEAVDYYLHRQCVSRPSVLITFDDGYRGVADGALPVINKYRIPAIVFISAGYVGNHQLFWFDRLALAVAYSDKTGVVFDGRRFPLETLEQKQEVVREVEWSVKNNPFSSRERIVDLFCLDMDSDVPDDLVRRIMPLDEDQLQKLCKCPFVTIGSHGVWHTHLSSAGLDLENEISDSRWMLSRFTGRSVEFFSYPNSDYTWKIRQKVESHGYKLAFSVNPIFDKSGKHPYEIGRLGINANYSFPIFVFKIIEQFINPTLWSILIYFSGMRWIDEASTAN